MPPSGRSPTRSAATCPTTRSCTAMRAASPYPEWGVGTVAGIYFTGEDDEMQQWARVQFSHGVRTVPAGSMKFVDFSKPDSGKERTERFLIAGTKSDGRRRVRAGRTAPDLRPRRRAAKRRGATPADARVLAGGEPRGGGSLSARMGAGRRRRPAAHRFAARIYEDIGAIDLAEEAAARAVKRGPTDTGAWERLGRLRLEVAGSRGRVGSLGAHRGAWRGGGAARPPGAGAWRWNRACRPRRRNRAQDSALEGPQNVDQPRETIRPIVTSETIDSMPMTLFAMCVSGIVSVGEKAAALVSEYR